MSIIEKQAKFIKETLDKVHNDITKFIIDTNTEKEAGKEAATSKA